MANFDLLKAKEDLDRAIAIAKENKNNEKNREFFGSLITNLGGLMSKTMEKVSEDNEKFKSDITDRLGRVAEVIKEIKILNTVNVPEVKVPEANVKIENPPMVIPKQEIEVKHDPIVIPPIETKAIEEAIAKGIKSAFKGLKIEVPIPDIKMPKIAVPSVEMPQEMQVKGEVSIENSQKAPLYMQMVDMEGKPYFPSTSVGGGSGGSRQTRVIQSTYLVESSSKSSSGDSIVLTPPTGKKIRLYYVNYSKDGGTGTDLVAYIKFGSNGDAKYRTAMKGGSTFARNIGAGQKYIEGANDEALYLNLSAADTVNYTFEYEFI